MQPEILQEVRNRILNNAQYVDYMDGNGELSRLEKSKRMLSRYRNPLAGIRPISGGSMGCTKCKCSETVYKKQYPRVSGGMFNMELFK
jgi:hypothetical protein